MSNQLELEHISVDLDGTRIIDDVSFSLSAGDIGCLLGPSGCGKTTLLRTIGGFEAPCEGELCIAGKTVANAAHQCSPEERRVGMVFQDLALFPHMTVLENVAFGMRMQKTSKADVKQRAWHMLELVKLDHLAERKPRQLSGGQQQRVALARAMAPGPKVL